MGQRITGEPLELQFTAMNKMMKYRQLELPLDQSTKEQIDILGPIECPRCGGAGSEIYSYDGFAGLDICQACHGGGTIPGNGFDYIGQTTL